MACPPPPQVKSAPCKYPPAQMFSKDGNLGLSVEPVCNWNTPRINFPKYLGPKEVVTGKVQTNYKKFFDRLGCTFKSAGL